jgi:hypothetical protein
LAPICEDFASVQIKMNSRVTLLWHRRCSRGGQWLVELDVGGFKAMYLSEIELYNALAQSDRKLGRKVALRHMPSPGFNMVVSLFALLVLAVAMTLDIEKKAELNRLAQTKIGGAVTQTVAP